MTIRNGKKASFQQWEEAFFVTLAAVWRCCAAILLVIVAQTIASASEKSAEFLAVLSVAEQQAATGMKTGDASALWVARRTVNRAALVSDMGDIKPGADDIACLEAFKRFGAFAQAIIDAYAFSTLTGPEAKEMNAESRAGADEKAGLYLKARQDCASAANVQDKPAFSVPLGNQFSISSVEPVAMDPAERRRAMAAAMTHIFEAERQIVAAVDSKSVSSIDPAFGKAAAALFAFGYSQAAIPKGEPDFLACRRLGGMLGQLMDMAAASVDLRFAQGKNFDMNRWPDAVSEFDFVRSDAEIRRNLCTQQLGWKQAQGLLIPEKLLDRVRAP
jgi:hypothetical protein